MYLLEVQYNQSTLNMYHNVMKLTNNNEKSDNAQKKLEARFL